MQSLLITWGIPNSKGNLQKSSFEKKTFQVCADINHNISPQNRQILTQFVPCRSGIYVCDHNYRKSQPLGSVVHASIHFKEFVKQKERGQISALISSPLLCSKLRFQGNFLWNFEVLQFWDIFFARITPRL